MTHWIQGELILLDTETDLPNPCEAHLVQAALVKIKGRDRLFERTWLTQPRRPIPDEAVAVHKITNEYAMQWGQPHTEVLADLRDNLHYLWNTGNVLIGHNVGFDLSVIDCELFRCFGEGLTIAGPVVDTLLCDKRVDKWRPGKRTLITQCEHYGLTLSVEDAHDALTDALAAGRLAYRLATMRRWPRGRYGPSKSEREARALLATGDAWALHEAQKQWHTEGQLELAEYFRGPKAIEKIRKRKAAGEITAEQVDELIAGLPAAAAATEATARGCWPLIPRVLVTT